MILLAYDLPVPASEDEKEKEQENLLITDYLLALFSRPDMHSKMESMCTLYLFFFIIKKQYVLMMSSNSTCVCLQ